MGLTITRKGGESVLIGDSVRVTVFRSTTPDRIKLVIDAPRGVKILREELVGKCMESADATRATDVGGSRGR